ncbi:5-methyltetrahydropteroyltriglutamate--homocysteine methyltransferase [Nannochloropsis oceanica]
MSVKTSTIGYPRIGPNREMKKALEEYWAGKSSKEALIAVAKQVEESAWKAQADAGVDFVALDGTCYDQMLDHCTYLGLLPPRFQELSGLDQYFAAARGHPPAITALDMSKLMDSNYHYLVPELTADSAPQPNWAPFLDAVRRGQATVGKDKACPMLIGPVTFTVLSRGDFDRSTVIQRLLPAYQSVLVELAKLGVPEVQFHEPVLALSAASLYQADVELAYKSLTGSVPIHLVVPYDDVAPEVYPWLVALPVHAIGLDFCGVPGAPHGNATCQLIAKNGFPADKRLGVGVIDGRSPWADDGTAIKVVAALRKLLGPNQAMTVQSSTSLQHVPIDVNLEKELPSDVKARLAFAQQKLGEMVAVKEAVSAQLSAGAGDLNLSTYTGAPSAGPTAKSIPADFFKRPAPFAERRPQQPQFHAFPTTTIGSFPQTPAIRRARLQFKKGTISEIEYRERIGSEIGYSIGAQEALGLDVLVHGEPERTDMVEYFGMKLKGYSFTQHAWVQSYGSRYVRPPLITGDVSRLGPMTVHEFELAQSMTNRAYVKGMLTGAVTCINWSFPRKDITRSEQAYQIALALREEIADLEKAGCRIIQVDDPAIREGLPLKTNRQAAYLEWAAASFRLSTGVATSACQIVTHLCYSDFEEILGAIDALDADVLTIENSRSGDEMVKALATYGYSRDIGPGVYDVHSPVVPSVESMASKARAYVAAGIDVSKIWLNPDCGLKTRRWEEVLPSLRNMVSAAKLVREEMAAGGKSQVKGVKGAH